jgi:hypothetical protein
MPHPAIARYNSMPSGASSAQPGACRKRAGPGHSCSDAGGARHQRGSQQPGRQQQGGRDRNQQRARDRPQCAPARAAPTGHGMLAQPFHNLAKCVIHAHAQMRQSNRQTQPEPGAAQRLGKLDILKHFVLHGLMSADRPVGRAAHKQALAIGQRRLGRHLRIKQSPHRKRGEYELKKHRQNDLLAERAQRVAGQNRQRVQAALARMRSQRGGQHRTGLRVGIQKQQPVACGVPRAPQTRVALAHPARRQRPALQHSNASRPARLIIGKNARRVIG